MYETTTFMAAAMVWLFYMSSNPLFISLFLILLTITLALPLMATKASWLFMAIVIMFLGGMMVVFVYASSLSTNKKVTLTFLKSNLILLVIVASINQIWPNLFFKKSCQVNPSLMYEESSTVFLMLLAFYLLLTLMILIKIIRWKEGPLKAQFK